MKFAINVSKEVPWYINTFSRKTKIGVLFDAVGGIVVGAVGFEFKCHPLKFYETFLNDFIRLCSSKCLEL